MSEITAVPLRPVGKGGVAALWAGVALLLVVGVGGAWDKWFIESTPELKKVQTGSMLYVFAL